MTSKEAFFDWDIAGDRRVDPGCRGGGMLADPGTHSADLVLWLGGGRRRRSRH